MIYFKTPVLLLFIASVSLLAEPQTQKANDNANSSAKVNGIWALTFESNDTTLQNPPVFDNANSKKVVLFTSSDKKVQMTDPATGMVWVGQITGEFQSFRVNLPVKDQVSGNTKLLTMDGSIKGNTIVGVMKLDSGTGTWKAVKLPSAWQCSNHKPSHVATSEDEMRSLTTKYKCLGWHKLEVPQP
jgi:hypothetical protein